MRASSHPRSVRRLVWSFLAHIERSPLFRLSLEGRLDWSPTARVQRGSSETARCTSTEDRLACSLMLPSSSLAYLFRAAWAILECAYPTMLLQFATFPSGGVAQAALYCAHRTSTFRSCAFCEQEGHLTTLSQLSKLPRYLSRDGA